MEAVERSNSARRTSRSKFSKTNSGADFQLAPLSKPPAQIERELKQRFEQDGFEFDQDFAQQVIQQARRDESVFKETLQSPEKAEEYTVEEMQDFVDWMIRDCEEYLANQDKDQAQRDRDIDTTVDSMLSSEPTPENMAATFGQMEKLADDLRSPGIDKLAQFLRLINSKGNDELRKYIPLESLVQLFDIATQINDVTKRSECIYLAGSLLYKATDARADPINEMFYIEALLEHRQFHTAESLFASRKNKPDVKGQRFWTELGVRVYLKGRKTRKMEALVSQLKDSFNYISPDLCVELVEWYVSKDQFAEAFDCWTQIQAVMNSEGLIDKLPEQDVALLDDQQQVYAYHNRKEPVTYGHVTRTTQLFLQHGRYDEAMRILETATRRDKRFLLHFMSDVRQNVGFAHRELLRHALQANPRYPASMKKFMVQELSIGLPFHTKSIAQAQTLVDIAVSLRSLDRARLLSQKDRVLAFSIIDTINVGQPLSSREARDVFRLLLRVKTKDSYLLVNEMLNEMNASVGKPSGTQIFPPASSHVYLLLVQLFGRQKKPDLARIDAIVEQMEFQGVHMLTIMANQLIQVYCKAGRPDRAVQLVQYFVHSERFRLTEEFCRLAFGAYRSMQIQSTPDVDAYKKRLAELRQLFREFCSQPEMQVSEQLLNEMVLTFFKYGDYVSVICVLEHYGLVCNRDLEKTTLLLVGDCLERSLRKMKSKLNAHEKTQSADRIAHLEQTLALETIKKTVNIQPSLSWRDAAAHVVQFLAVFDYKPNPYWLKDKTGQLKSEHQKEQAKTRFNTMLTETQNQYGLPEVWISDIVQL